MGRLPMVTDDKMGRVFRWCLLPLWGVAVLVVGFTLFILVGAMLVAAMPVTLLLYGALFVVKATAPKSVVDEMPNIFP